MSRKFLSALGACAILLQTPAALAAYVSPGALYLHLMQNPLRAADMTVKAYMEEKTEGVQVYAEASVATEGRTVANLKQKMGFMVSASHPTDGSLRVNGEAMIKGTMIYVRITDLQAQGSDALTTIPQEVRDAIPTPWLTLDITEHLTDADLATANGNIEQSLRILSDELKNQGIHLSSEELKDLIKAFIDSVFEMSHTRFKGGNSYVLNLHPEFIERFLSNQTLMSAISKVGGEHMDEADMADAMEEVREAQSMVKQALTLKTKIDTNDDDELRFMRTYAAFDHADVPFFASMQMEVKHRTAGVYLDIPQASQTEDLETFMERVTGMDMPEEEWSEDSWDEDSWDENEWEDAEDEDDWGTADWTEDDWQNADWGDDEEEMTDEEISMPSVRRVGNADCTRNSRSGCVLKPNRRSIRSDAWEGSPSVNRSSGKVRAKAMPKRIDASMGDALALSETHGTAFSHIIGGKVDAPVTLYVYADLEDPFFARHHETLGKLMLNEANIRWVYTPYPLYFHHDSLSAAVAAECVHRSKYNLLDDFIAYAIDTGVTKDDIAGFAAKHGLGAEFHDCQKDVTLEAEIAAAQSAAYLMGINASPTTFIVNELAKSDDGTVQITGAQTESMIREAIAKVKTAK